MTRRVMQTSDLSDARVGDEVLVESHRLGGARKPGVIVEVLGSPEHRYFLVRWQDGHETVFHPGSDAVLRPKGRRRRPKAAGPQPAVRPKAPTKASAEGPRRPPGLRASPGDRLLIRGHHLGEPTRDAEVLEALGPDRAPPFRVRWWDTGREGVLFPGPDAAVEHLSRRRPR
jgi:hypothetical protein